MFQQANTCNLQANTCNLLAFAFVIQDKCLDWKFQINISYKIIVIGRASNNNIYWTD